MCVPLGRRSDVDHDCASVKLILGLAWSQSRNAPSGRLEHLVNGASTGRYCAVR